MQHRTFMSLALGVAVATTASAQKPTHSRQTAKSDQRITISKGEVVLPRVDTVYVTRYDTAFIRRADTIRVPVQVTRHDTIVLTEPAPLPMPSVKGPLYAGLFAGSTLPSGNVDRLYTTGFHLGALLGFEPAGALLGGRVTGSIAQLGRHAGYAVNQVGSNTPILLAFSGDLKVMPVNFAHWRLYGIAGVNYDSYRDIATAARSGTGFPSANEWFVPAKSDWSDRFGFNAGAGMDFNLDGQEMFIESRAMTFRADGARTWFVPISFGLRYF